MCGHLVELGEGKAFLSRCFSHSLMLKGEDLDAFPWQASSPSLSCPAFHAAPSLNHSRPESLDLAPLFP